MNQETESPQTLKERIYTVIFEADTPGGKFFDVTLIIAIALSVLVVMLDSVQAIHADYETLLLVLEWIFTVLFTIEYVLRIYCIGNKIKYIGSFFGLVDLLAILPTYISLFFPGSRYMAVIRILRIIRVFRVLKFAKYVREMEVLFRALRASRRKIFVFLFAITMLVVILGSIMYLIEGSNGNGKFTSIPKGVYWAIVTMTTVGYGDIAPETDLGQAVAAFVMIIGYSVLAVPTGIVTVELGRAARGITNNACPHCSREGHDPDADYCKFCGTKLE
jgi:voltage-gated potassium channel